jgi:predicted nucleic acid-binding protein
VILIDTSAWVEFLRDTGSRVCNRVEKLLGTDIASCDAIRMELLAGARNQQHLVQLRRLLAGTALVATEPGDYDQAAALYRQCRISGDTPRKLIDCLIAAVAIRTGAPVLHSDTDFDVLAKHTPLDIVAD